MGEVVGDVIVKKNGNGYRLVLLPLPLQGHINSMLQLAQILYSQGFSITILHTTFNSPSPSNFPHFTFHSISEHLLESDTSTSDITALLSILNIKCAEPIRQCLSSLLLVPPVSNSSSVHFSRDRDRDRDQIACLITDSVWYCTAETAKEFRIARVELRTTSISSFRAFSALMDLRENKACSFPLQPSQEEKLLQDHPLKEIWPLTLKDLPYLESTKNPADFYELLENMTKSMKAATGVVVNSFEELETGHLTYFNGTHVPVPVFLIGPFHKHFPSTCSSFLEHDLSSIDWLDKQDEKSVLYVSFGSIASMSQSQIQDIASALADSGSPFLWVVRSGGLHGSVPNGLMDSLTRIGRIVTWAPQAEVLAHRAIAGFWTHCGWNSTLESVCEGVPMICTPFFGDQKVNACYISKVWKVGLYLEIGEGKGEMKSAITRLMVGEEGERMRERIRKLRDQVELCYKPGGSSYKALQSLTNLLVSVDATTQQTKTLR